MGHPDLGDFTHDGRSRPTLRSGGKELLPDSRSKEKTKSKNHQDLKEKQHKKNQKNKRKSGQ